MNEEGGEDFLAPNAAYARCMIRPLAAAQTRPLRSIVLRDGFIPAEALVYDGDDHPRAFHAGAFDGERLVGVATIYPEPMPAEHVDAATGAAFRLRGMATLAEVRRAGHGRQLLEACFDHVRSHNASVIWCNARVVARPFYERLGFVTVGEVFQIDPIGPHYVMWRRV